MTSAPNPGPSAATAVLASVAAIGIWRLLAVAAPHLAALALMCETETDFGSRLSFALSWGILNFFWITLVRRPALSGALSLTLVVVLVLLSRLKHDVVQMTVNFIDLMMIDRDTVAFLFTIFPNLRWSVILAGLVTLPLMYAASGRVERGLPLALRRCGYDLSLYPAYETRRFNRLLIDAGFVRGLAQGGG
jgi:hypothetical protein